MVRANFISVPSRGEWSFLRNSDTYKIFLKTMFPYPFEVTKISYLVIPDEPKKPELFPYPREVRSEWGSSQVPFTNVDLKSGFRPLPR